MTRAARLKREETLKDVTKLLSDLHLEFTTVADTALCPITRVQLRLLAGVSRVTNALFTDIYDLLSEYGLTCWYGNFDELIIFIS